MSNDLKTEVRSFWDQASCGEVYAKGDSPFEYYESHRKMRYTLEPFLPPFAKFEEGYGKDVLEIGVGMGADHVEWAKSQPRSLAGIDLTPRAIEHVTTRLNTYGFESDVQVGDAERLPYADSSFDIVFSWGVLHHSPDTATTFEEIYRVLRPGGTARIMIYHKYSLTGYMLWLRYGLLAGRPLRSLRDIYWHHLESPGTNAFTVSQAKKMCRQFSQVQTRIQLCFGDLLEGDVGQRHRGLVLSLAKALWPRPALRVLCKNHGLDLLIEAKK